MATTAASKSQVVVVVIHGVVHGRPPLDCLVCGEDLPPGSTRDRNMSATADDAERLSSKAPITEYFHADGESCRPTRVGDDATSECNNDC